MVASLAFNLDRDEVIDYSLPVFPRYTLTLWKPLGNRAPSLDLTAYIDIFHTNVWIFIAISFLVTAAAFYIMDKSGNNHFHKVNNSEEFCFLNSVALSAILLIKLSYEVMIKSIPARIIYLVGSLVAYVLFSYYECDLTAKMTIMGASDDVKNFQDVTDQGYEVVVMESSADHARLKNTEGSAKYDVC